MVKVYADYLQYVFKHTQQFFIDNDVNGRPLWNRLLPSCIVVVTHPNGWGLREQHVLGKAIVDAGILPESRLLSEDSGLQFVTEGEASAHFCVFHGKLANKFEVRRQLFWIVWLLSH
jgi:hypothetical protein